MGSRRQARHYALQALYFADSRQLGANQATEALWAGLMDGEGFPDVRPPESDEVEFTQRLVDGVLTHRDELDALIESSSTNWRLVRMPLVDRNILRIAGYELSRCHDIPANVAVNEAIELAKLFGTADSRAFVNGIVDRMGRKLERLPPRRKGS